MGWCSGTELFDDVIAEIEKSFTEEQIHDIDTNAPITDERVQRLIKTTEAIIKAFWRNDWDCETDSRYITVPFVRQAFANLDRDFFRYEDED